eukprot:TRINITY_DN16892_c0_g1_i1.p1 TRINITY_DN16892_c0_g1~~TRINITY_DN16892_c0_g1_i1.p1  ORF type:complete len:315 (+),score=16.56 TRINITY_DN16892_c0_g1_i1:124-1068(+)
MVHILDVETAKCLSLVSRLISNTVKRLIEVTYCFSIPNERSFSYYQPKIIDDVTSVSQIDTSIRSVKFYYHFNECVDLSMFTNLMQLHYGVDYEQYIENRLQINLTYLTLSTNFNKPVSTLLPHKIIRIVFGYKFDKPITNLPISVTQLQFGNDFQQTVDGVLPPKLTHLSFVGKFNQPVNSLPGTLQHLSLSFFFNQPVNRLPHGLSHLLLDYFFRQSISDLPATITHLELRNTKVSIENLPLSLIHLTFGPSFNRLIESLPPSVQKVTFKGYYSEPKFCHPVSHLNSKITFQVAIFSVRGVIEARPYIYKPK